MGDEILSDLLSEGAKSQDLLYPNRWVRSKAFSEYGWHRISGRDGDLWFTICRRAIKVDDADLHSGERDPESGLWLSPKEGVVHAQCWWEDASGGHR